MSSDVRQGRVGEHDDEGERDLSLLAHVSEHPLVRGAVTSSGWNKAKAKDNDCAYKVRLACSSVCGTQQLVSKKSVQNGRGTEDSVLNDLLSKLHKHATEKFWAWVIHSDNANHFKSSPNLFWWSAKLDELLRMRDRDAEMDFIRCVWLEFGCPGHGKGPWDGFGAVVKTLIRKAITYEKCLTDSTRITCALEAAQHTRRAMSTNEWTLAHQHGTINDVVVFYIDAEEMESEFPAVEPTYSTLSGISSCYSFLTRPGEGCVAAQRYSCWCAACCDAFGAFKDNSALLQSAGCARRHLTEFKEERITCNRAPGIGNRIARAKALVIQLLSSSKLRSGQWVAVMARNLWEESEREHLRPGHFWIGELGDADGKGSPIIKRYEKREHDYDTRFDKGDAAICLRRWLHRTGEPTHLQFKHNPTDMGNIVVNSSELRAVGLVLHVPARPQRSRIAPGPQATRPRSERLAAAAQRNAVRGSSRSQSRSAPSSARRAVQDDPNLIYFLDPEDDAHIRALCEDS